MTKPITFTKFLEKNSHWDLQHMTRADTGNVRGFVYRIISKETKKFYIGSKRTSVANWPTYQGSSKRLAAHMEKNPTDEHEYQVILTASDSNAVLYGECSMQIITNAIHREDSWNEAIASQTWLRKTEGTVLVSRILDKLPLRWFDQHCLFLPQYTPHQL